MSNQRLGSGMGIGATRADRQDAVVGLDHISGAGKQQGMFGVNGDQHSFKAPQHFIHPPILGQLDRRTQQIAVVLLKLLLQPVIKGKGVGR